MFILVLGFLLSSCTGQGTTPTCRNPFERSPAVTSGTPGTPADYARDVTTRLYYALKDAAVRSTASKLNQKRQYDKKKFFHPHKPGDFVFLDDPGSKAE